MKFWRRNPGNTPTDEDADDSRGRWFCDRSGHRIETDTVRLTLLNEFDALVMPTLIDDVIVRENGWPDDFNRFVSPSPRLIGLQQTLVLGSWSQDFVIRRAGANAALGYLSLTSVGKYEVQLGFWIAAPARGQGFMTDAVIAASRFAFAHLGATRVVAGTGADNVACRRVLDKAGLMVYWEGTTTLPNDEDRPAVWMMLDYVHPSPRPCTLLTPSEDARLRAL